MDRINDYIHDIFTAAGHDLSEVEVAVRTILVYVSAVVLVRMAKKRFMAENTAFDVIIGIMLGSILSRGVNGSSELAPALVSALALVILHWIFSWLSFHSHAFGKLVKGNRQELVKNGELQRDQMKGGHISDHDLEAALRSEGVRDASEVELATLERSGDISVIRKEPAPRVVEVAVKDGVQTVRVEIG